MRDRCTVFAEANIGPKKHFRRNRWNSNVMWVKWKLISVHLKKVLVSVQDRCTVCAEHTIGSKIILMHPMVLQGDVGQVEACFGPFGDSVNPSAKLVNSLCQMYHGHGYHFGCTQWYT
jgi:hypothetical protein